MTHVNIDGDVINYSVGYASQHSMYEVDGKRWEDSEEALAYCDRYGIDSELIDTILVPEPVAFALSSAKRLINRIKSRCNASTYTVLLTGEGNFRDDVATLQPYKGNRYKADGTPKQPKPFHFQAIKDYLISVHGAEVIEGEEADDQLSIRCVERGDTIATIDKDLDNTAGVHYNWKHDELYTIGPVEADRNFHKQLLTGDGTDHIPGLFRLTGKRASKGFKDAIDEMTDTTEMYKHVYTIFHDAYIAKEKKLREADDSYLPFDVDFTATNSLTEIGQLLWMRRKDNELWTPPKL